MILVGVTEAREEKLNVFWEDGEITGTEEEVDSNMSILDEWDFKGGDE